MFPTRSNSAQTSRPDASTILSQLKNASDARVCAEFRAVSRYFKHDPYEIYDFWESSGLFRPSDAPECPAYSRLIELINAIKN